MQEMKDQYDKSESQRVALREAVGKLTSQLQSLRDMRVALSRKSIEMQRSAAISAHLRLKCESLTAECKRLEEELAKAKFEKDNGDHSAVVLVG